MPWAGQLPASTSSLSALSNQQLFRQAAHILHATSSGPGLKPEARTPPRLFESEACVPPKPSGLSPPSSPPANTVPHNKISPMLECLSSGTLLSYACRLASLPSKDTIFPRPATQLTDNHLPPMPFSTPEIDPRNFREEEPLPFNVLVSACYKKVANRIHPVRTTLPEEYCIVRRIPSDPLLSSSSADASSRLHPL